MTVLHKAALLLSAAAWFVCTGCTVQQQKPNFTQETSAAESTSAVPANKTPAAPPLLEEPLAAESGDAILAIADGDWYAQYFGNNTDLLAYQVGIARIDRNGAYTVSVDAGSDGCQYEATGTTNGGFVCKSLQYAAVKVLGTRKHHPNLSIEVTEIRVDGKAIELSARGYTCSENGIDMICNLYNPKATISEDAHTAEGAIDTENEEYAPCIVPLSQFDEWTKVEVDFTVSGY